MEVPNFLWKFMYKRKITISIYKVSVDFLRQFNNLKARDNKMKNISIAMHNTVHHVSIYVNINIVSEKRYKRIALFFHNSLRNGYEEKHPSYVT